MDSAVSPSQEIWDGQLMARVSIAAICFAFYDALLNIGDEVQLIWRSGSRSWVKWPYVIVRHVPYLLESSLIALIEPINWSHAQCRFWLVWQFTAVEVFTVTVEIVLVLRVYAMYNRNKTILGILATLLLGEIGAICTLLALTVPKISVESGGCLVNVTPKVFPYFWLIPLLFETTLFVLTLVRFFKSVARQRYVGGTQSIMFILMRDGTWAYAIIFVIMLLNTIFYTREHNLLDGLWFVWELSILSFAGSHILLNMRRLAVQPDGGSLWTGEMTTVIRFDGKTTNGTQDTSESTRIACQ